MTVTCRWGGPMGGGMPPGGGMGGMLGSKCGRAKGGRGGGPLIIPKGGGGGRSRGGGPRNTGVWAGAGADVGAGAGTGAGPRNRTACCAILGHNENLFRLSTAPYGTDVLWTLQQVQEAAWSRKNTDHNMRCLQCQYIIHKKSQTFTEKF